LYLHDEEGEAKRGKMREKREGKEGAANPRRNVCKMGLLSSSIPPFLASFLNPPSLPASFPFHQIQSQSASAFVPAAKLVQPAAVTVGRKAATSMKLDLPAVVAGLAPAAFLTAPAFGAGMDGRMGDG
jgi:hypothetical protein